MKILEVTSLAITDVRVLRFARFEDNRGYFTETFRRSELDAQATFLSGVHFVQMNESYSRPGVVRGLHFQWNPYMGKLVRTVSGRMVDLVLDIRLGSPTFGKIVAHDMPASSATGDAEWIWVPPGFAHGNYFTEDTVIEYLCSGVYAPGNEAAVSPVAQDIDWSLCAPELRQEFADLAAGSAVISEKDRAGVAVGAWANDARARNFLYDDLSKA